ncbi:Cytochrome b-c1 complex subunit 9, partial [Fragariocoptes setiger]
MANQIVSTLYRNIFRRSSTFAVAILVGAIFADRGVSVLAEAIFERINEGRLWKHVKEQRGLK